jgi:phage baseplate assembly protein W
MALSPLDNVGADVAEVVTEAGVLPSRTYALDIDTGSIGGIVDGTDAIKQFIIKAILTARFRFPIYNADYGCELEELIGSNVSAALLQTEIPRVITETLIYDDRITDVHSFEIFQEADKLFVSFVVETDVEAIPIERLEVSSR